MSTAARRSALAALDAARPSIARLDTSRHPEDQAADLIESWSAVEAALRSLVGSSTLTGQALIREARQRQFLSFDQANALAEWLAARDRAERVEYRPTPTDIAAAREGFVKLESGLMNEGPQAVPSAAIQAQGVTSTLNGTPTPVPPPDGAATRPLDATPKPRPRWLVPTLIGIFAVVVIALGAWALLGHRRSAALQQAVDEYRRGQRDQAAADFAKAERENPNDPLPHVYLSRMAREVGNLTVAQQEAQLAVQADPHSSIALREMASYLLTVGNYDLARRFYVRAVQADTSDRTAMGWLGCTMYKLGRADEGQKWVTRAGPGAWDGCAQGAPGAPGITPTLPPGTTPGQIPQNPPGVRTPQP